MSATFNRSRIMQAAHATAKRQIASVGGSYREWFAKALRTEWKRAKEAKARREQNIGLPLRSCPADEPAAYASLRDKARPPSRVACPSQTQGEIPRSLHAVIRSPRHKLRGVIVKLGGKHEPISRPD